MNTVDEIQGYIVSTNKEKLAEQISYPISVIIKDKIIKIQNKDEFIKNYDQIFNANYKEAIAMPMQSTCLQIIKELCLEEYYEKIKFM